MYCLEFYFVCSVSIHFDYKILFMDKKIFNSLEDYNRHLEQLFAQKNIKSLGKMKLWICLTNGRR